MFFRPVILAAAVLAAGLSSLVTAPPAEAATLRWQRTVAGGWFQWSSPVIADVNGDGRNDIVVGGLDKKVYAWDADGNPLPGWASGAPATASVASSPAVGDVDGDGRNEVVVGTGSLNVEGGFGGALNIFNADGSRRCTIATNGGHEGNAVYNAPAIGDVTGDRVNDIVFGSFDHLVRVVDGRCNLLASFDNRDSIFSAPALYDVSGDGTAEIFIGGDATENPSVRGDSHNGGYFRSLSYRPGHNVAGQFHLAQLWQRTSSEAFQGSAAIGDVDGDRDLEVVTGSGAFYCRHRNICGDSNKVWAFDLDDGHDTPGWVGGKRTTFETTYLASPALGDIDGDGRTDVAVITNQYNQGSPHKEPNGGAVDVFFGHGGKDTYVATGDLEIMSAPIIADMDGGTPEVIITDKGQFYALNKNLDVVQTGFGPDLAHKSAAAVGDLRPAAAPGAPRWALVTVGFAFPPKSPDGSVHVYDIPAPASVPWPQFQMDARRLGNDLYAPSAPRSPGAPSAPVTAPPPAPSTTVTTKPKPKPAPTASTKAPAPPTTAAPPPETTTTLPPETTTTLPPTTTTTDDTTELVGLRGKDESAGDGGGSPLVGVLLGLVAVGGGGGLFHGWRRRRLG